MSFKNYFCSILLLNIEYQSTVFTSLKSTVKELKKKYVLLSMALLRDTEAKERTEIMKLIKFYSALLIEIYTYTCDLFTINIQYNYYTIPSIS